MSVVSVCTLRTAWQLVLYISTSQSHAHISARTQSRAPTLAHAETQIPNVLPNAEKNIQTSNPLCALALKAEFYTLISPCDVCLHRHWPANMKCLRLMLHISFMRLLFSSLMAIAEMLKVMRCSEKCGSSQTPMKVRAANARTSQPQASQQHRITKIYCVPVCVCVL